MANYAAILAGGESLRFAGSSQTSVSLPKQFAKIGDQTVIEMAISKFCESEKIDGVVIVMNSKHIDLLNNLIKEKVPSIFAKKIIAVIPGGETRALSSFEAVKFLRAHGNNNDNLLIHDAARPFVTVDLIERSIAALESADAVQPIIPVTQTIVHNVEGKWVTENRADFATVQTPQSFKLHKIDSAFSKCAIDLKDPKFTDDISVFCAAFQNDSVSVVDGDVNNRKITFESDLH